MPSPQKAPNSSPRMPFSVSGFSAGMVFAAIHIQRYGRTAPHTKRTDKSTRLFAFLLLQSYLYGYSSRRFASYLTASTFAYISPSA